MRRSLGLCAVAMALAATTATAQLADPQGLVPGNGVGFFGLSARASGPT